MPEETIPERVKRICEKLGADGKEIRREDIILKTAIERANLV